MNRQPQSTVSVPPAIRSKPEKQVTEMNKIRVIWPALWMCLAAASAGAEDVVASATWDGLIEVKPRRMDAAFLMPGADFRPYQKLMLDPATVAFRKDWMKRVNTGTRLSQRVSQEDAEKIAAAARDNFTEVFTEAFRKAGYEIVTAPGVDVLRVRAGVIDLYIAAPDTQSSGRSRTYTMEAGEATLFLEVRDSSSGALLGRALDQRATRNTGNLTVANQATNLGDFRALFRKWADISVKGLDNLRELSPVPEELKPGQKLGP
jgi:hypothetical protein